jgi:NAD(P)-dependent dehydrogenase (short-subunit alcohol dehydrogenase family)
MNTTQGEALVAKLGEGNAIFIKADVSKWEENVKFFKTTKEKFGRVDFGTAWSPFHGLMIKLLQMRGLTIRRICLFRAMA